MQRAIKNYKIAKRKDGRYYVRLQDGGALTQMEKLRLLAAVQDFNTMALVRRAVCLWLKNSTMQHLCYDAVPHSTTTATKVIVEFVTMN